MDEVFGAENFVSQIWYQTTTQSTGKHLSKVGDFILWFAKDKKEMHYNQMFLSKSADLDKFPYVLLNNGECRNPTQEEKMERPFPQARDFSKQPDLLSGRCLEESAI